MPCVYLFELLDAAIDDPYIFFIKFLVIYCILLQETILLLIYSLTDAPNNYELKLSVCKMITLLNKITDLDVFGDLFCLRCLISITCAKRVVLQ